MEIRRDIMIPAGLAIAIVGAAATGGLYIGDLQSKSAASARQNTKQWELLSAQNIKIAMLEGKLAVLSSELNGFKEFKTDTKRQLRDILLELRKTP